jgi:filamentous hemagglutinin
MAVAGGAVYLMSKGDLAQAASVGATGAEVASKVENEAPAATEVAQETGNAGGGTPTTAPSSAALSKMDQIYNNKPLLNSNYDCSEIAEDIYKANGSKGEILNFTSSTGDLNVVENGSSKSYVYHQVYSDGNYVYDPRWNNVPISKDNYIQMLKNMNGGNVSIEVLHP